jgi:C terminal of Calcineurin-like phosphoesterase/N terminal of Calcineurin-like phosphoesterase/Calcineurin-like phosphoesterase
MNCSWNTRRCTCLIIVGLGLMLQTGLCAGSQPPSQPPSQVAQGMVYEDLNNNRRRDADELGLEGVKVSNGKDIVLTDAQGKYQLPVSDDCIIFVIKPRGWMTPLNVNKLPQFYYIHKPAGSPANFKYPGVAPTGPLPSSIDFPLTQQSEPEQFRALLFGDTQPRNVKEVEYMTHDIIEQIITEKKHGASLGVTLGDVVFDDLDVFEPHNQAIALLGLPWYNVIGNHDMNYDAANDKLSDETFERHYGPSYYSFDYGTVHFLALDDVMWHGPTAAEQGRFTGGFGPEQMQFIKHDLSLIPKDQLVVLLMHVPLVNVDDRQELYRLIEDRPFALSISAHTHYLKHHFIGQEDGFRGANPHHHFVNVTVCGSWWRGATDEQGIPHATMSDGGPNGYSIISFDGAKYDIEFRAARRPAEHQMTIHMPEAINSAQALTTPLVVNVFNGSKRSTARFRVLPSGAWQAMERVDGVDPHYLQMKLLEASATPPNGTPLPAPSVTDHLWRSLLPATLPVGTHIIEVEATDINGKVHVNRRAIRVEEIPKPAPKPANAVKAAKVP